MAQFNVLKDTVLDALIASVNTALTGAQTAETGAQTAEASAITAKNDAQAAQTAAQSAETNAQSSASSAALSASNASTSANNASTSETNAATSATNASTSASNAATAESNAASSASAASTSEANALASEQKAQKWADELENVEVETGKYSALHHAAKASVSASSASASASSATTSASNAATSASNASTSASNASTSETNALASENKANEWATKAEDLQVETGLYSALHHAAKAAASASTASTQASNASTSASNAATSESNAATSASNASTSASNALASENKADQWANEAEDVIIETGKFSAFHWMKKAEAQANLAIQGLRFDDQVASTPNLPAPPPEGDNALYYIDDIASGAIYDATSFSWNIFAMGTIDLIGSMNDVTITAVTNGEVLKYSAGQWINNTLAEAGISAVGHDHDAAAITSGTFANARISASSVTQHQASLSIAWGQISGAPAFLTTITGEVIGDLSNVTISAIASGEVLKWNGSAFVNNTLAEAGIAAASHTHDASAIDSGTLGTARIPSLDASKITSGTFGTARIPNLPASKVTSGTFADNRISQSSVTQHQGSLSISVTQITPQAPTTKSAAWSANAGESRYYRYTGSANINFTIGTGIYSAGDVIYVEQAGTGIVTVVGSGSTINSFEGTKTAGQYDVIGIKCVATNTYTVIGGIT